MRKVTKTDVSSSWVYVNGIKMFSDANCHVWESIENFDGDENRWSATLKKPLPFNNKNIISYDAGGNNIAANKPTKNIWGKHKPSVSSIRIA